MEGRGEGEEKGEGKTKEGRREHPPLAGPSSAHDLRERTPPTPQQRGAGQAFLNRLARRKREETERDMRHENNRVCWLCPLPESGGTRLGAVS